MAIRNIRESGDNILRKKSKEVVEITPKLGILIEDMLDTMYENNGCGLAAVQVGILRRIVVIDVSPEGDSPMILVNPEVVEVSGEQKGQEGCLSVPGMAGIVERPNYAKVKAYNERMEKIIVEGEELMARCLLHEIDHLDGKLYIDLVEGELYKVGDEEE